LDPQDILARPDAQGLILGMERQDTGQMYRCMGNVLEYAAFRMYPSLAQWSRDFRKLGAEMVMMSGSGPTLTAFARDEEQARLLASNMRQPDWTVLLTRTLTADDLAKGMIFFGDPPIQDDMLEEQIAQNLDAQNMEKI
jgi:4-diphosphocytidyl-2-C-methyl-D-erythritol kinase